MNLWGHYTHKSMMSAWRRPEWSNSTSSMRTCHAAARCVWERFVEVYFSPFNIGDCVSFVACMTTWMVKLSHWHWVGRKRTTEDGKLPGSDHTQRPYILLKYIYSIYMQGVMVRSLWPATLDWKVLGTGLGCHGLALCPWARHFTCMCTLSTQEWMGTQLDSDCLCVWIVASTVMAAGLYAPQGVELVLEHTGPITRENWCVAHRNLI